MATRPVSFIDQQLFQACEEGSSEQVSSAIEKGANVDATDKFLEETPLIVATKKDFTEGVEILLSNNAKTEVTDGHKRTALLWAARKGYLKTANLLIKAGANVNAEDTLTPERFTPLVYAVAQRKRAMVDDCLASGAKIDIGITALVKAASVGDEELVQLFIERGADVNAVVPGGYLPIVRAAKKGHLTAIKILINAGADVNKVEAGQLSALMMLARDFRGEQGKEIARVLLKAGARTDLTDLCGATALQLAERVNNNEIAKLLREAL